MKHAASQDAQAADSLQGNHLPSQCLDSRSLRNFGRINQRDS